MDPFVVASLEVVTGMNSLSLVTDATDAFVDDEGWSTKVDPLTVSAFLGTSSFKVCTNFGIVVFSTTSDAATTRFLGE